MPSAKAGLTGSTYDSPVWRRNQFY